MFPAGVSTPSIHTARAAPFSWLDKEAVFWVGIMFWCFLPTRLVHPWNIFGFPMASVDASVVLIAFFYGLGQLVKVRTTPVPGGAASFALLATLVGAVAYAAVSFGWSGLNAFGATLMGSTLISTGAAAFLGYSMIQGRTAAEVRSFLWRLTLCVSLVGFAYSAESMFVLGLRGVTSGPSEFGIERVRGPLFESSTGYFVLLPALGFAIQETLERRVGRTVGVTVSFVLLVTILGLGSRAGLMILGLFVVLSILLLRQKSAALVLAVLMLVAGAGAWMLVFSRANTSRLLDLQTEDGRMGTHRTSLRILMNRPITETIFGSGYGSLWPWQVTEAEIAGQDAYSTGRFLRLVPEGALLYHPHSTMLMLIMELGLAGILLALTLATTLIGAVRRSARLGSYTVFACGTAVAGLSLFFDLFLFRRPTRDTIWWLFVFGLLSLIPRTTRSQYPAKVRL